MPRIVEYLDEELYTECACGVHIGYLPKEVLEQATDWKPAGNNFETRIVGHYIICPACGKRVYIDGYLSQIRKEGGGSIFEK